MKELNFDKMLGAELRNDIKRWTIYDTITRRVYDLTDQGFSEGLNNNMIKLRGQFIEVENNHKIWIDGIIK
jgi:hypothetical protein